MKDKWDTFVLAYFNARIGRVQSNILIHNSYLEILCKQEDANLTIKYKRS
jgi:hypothetical protein